MIELVLPYPISANRYWRPVRIGAHITIVPTKEAKAYKREIEAIVRQAGAKLIAGRVSVRIDLFPHRPLDWAKRAAKDPLAWDDTVQCLDIDNANKVVLDALRGLAFEDDSRIRRLHSERQEPDARGQRVQVHIEPVERQAHPQGDLLGELAPSGALIQPDKPWPRNAEVETDPFGPIPTRKRKPEHAR